MKQECMHLHQISGSVDVNSTVRPPEHLPRTSELPFQRRVSSIPIPFLVPFIFLYFFYFFLLRIFMTAVALRMYGSVFQTCLLRRTYTTVHLV